MAAATHYVSVPPPTLTSRDRTPVPSSNASASALQTNVNKSSTTSLNLGVPVKFADQSFSIIVKEQVSRLLDLPQIKQLKRSEENAARTVTFEITEMLKRTAARHVKENYKVVIQVTAYPKQDEDNLLIVSRCLWNYRTDDVLSVETETDAFKFLIVVHGVLA